MKEDTEINLGFLFWTGRRELAVSWGHPAYSFIGIWQSKLIFYVGLLFSIGYTAQKREARKWHTNVLSGECFLLRILEKGKKKRKKVLTKFLEDSAASPEVKGVAWLIEMSLLSRSDRIRICHCFIYMAIKMQFLFSLDKDLIPFVILTSMKTQRKHDENFHRWKIFWGTVQDSRWYKQVVLCLGRSEALEIYVSEYVAPAHSSSVFYGKVARWHSNVLSTACYQCDFRVKLSFFGCFSLFVLDILIINTSMNKQFCASVRQNEKGTGFNPIEIGFPEKWGMIQMR